MTLLASYDPRDARERRRFARERDELVSSLRARGLDTAAEQVDTTLFTVSLEPSLTPREKVLVADLQIGRAHV